AYEQNKPVKVEHFLKWSVDGSQEGDLIFVAGHPGRTDRLNTVASLEYLRDVYFPLVLDHLKRKEAFLLAYGHRGAESARQAKEDLFSVQNSRKARVGGLEGLSDEALIRRKAQAELKLRSRIHSTAKGSDVLSAAWGKIAQAQKTSAKILKTYAYL